jgi:DNA modification methylase
MDPFNGAGATSKSAIDLGRNALGFDIEPKYVDLAKQRLVQGTGIRDQQLTMSIVPRGEFVPGKSQGKTRHGAGISTRKVEI